MARSHVFINVTAELVHRLKRNATEKHGVLFDPPGGTDGTATAHTPLGDLVVHFTHDNVQSALVMTLVKKPMLLPSALLWSGFSAELERTREHG